MARQDQAAKRTGTGAKVPWYLPKNRRYRRHLKFTREGKLFVFVTLGLGFGAVNTGTNLMYLVFGFMLSLIILSGVLSEHVLRKLRVTRRLPSRVFVGEPALIEIAVRNEKQRLVSYSIEIEDHADEQPNDRRCYFLKVVPALEQVASYRRVFARRGRVHFSTFRVATRFPFALFEKWRELVNEDDLIVYPARLKSDIAPGTFEERGEQEGNRGARGTETRELREYQSRDEMRAVHWKRSASRGRLVVREFAREAGKSVSIRLDNLQRDPQDEAWLSAFEAQISRATYLTEFALKQGLAVEVCARGVRSARLSANAPPDAIFRFLALLAPVQDASIPMHTAQAGSRLIEPKGLGQDERAA